MAVMMEVGFHLRLPPPPSLHTFLLPNSRNPICHFHCRPISISHHRLLLLLSPWPLHIRRSRRWDSNAESYNTKNFDFGDNNEIEDFDDSVEQWAEALEDYIDSIWIFKVFGSFGWMLPPILFSMLLATGPKAFLMALALPLGQSTFTFAIQRFQNRDKIKRKGKNKNKKRRSRSYTSRNFEMEETPEWIGGQGTRKKKKEYQSWFSNTDVTTSSNDRDAANFGGWDELDLGMDSNLGSSRSAAQKSSGLRGTPAQRGKKRRLSESDGPLLLRLLISIFPFLSSWTKVL